MKHTKILIIIFIVVNLLMMSGCDVFLSETNQKDADNQIETSVAQTKDADDLVETIVAQTMKAITTEEVPEEQLSPENTSTLPACRFGPHQKHQHLSLLPCRSPWIRTAEADLERSMRLSPFSALARQPRWWHAILTKHTG